MAKIFNRWKPLVLPQTNVGELPPLKLSEGQIKEHQEIKWFMPEHIDVGGGLYRCTFCNDYVWEDKHLHKVEE